jgi:hypothetical protein
MEVKERFGELESREFEELNILFILLAKPGTEIFEE